MRIKSLNHYLKVSNQSLKNIKQKGFGSNSQVQLEVQQQSYETSGSVGRTDKKMSVPLRNVYLSGNMSKVSKTPYGVISFGNKNQKHQVFVGAEMPPYCKIGGVATVMEDYKGMFDDDEDNRKVMVIPYYNAAVCCDHLGKPTGKHKVHIFPSGTKNANGEDLSGQPFYTASNLDEIPIEDIIKKGQYKELELISKGKMDFAFQEDEEIALYRVKGTNHFMVFSQGTASMPKPYTKRMPIGEGGTSQTGYASNSGGLDNGWDGDPYAEFNKAFVQLLPKIEKTYNLKGEKEDTAFEPATVICSDAQTAYIPHYMATSGEAYYQDEIKPTYVAHNLGQGYIAPSNYKEMYINLGATAKYLHTVKQDPNYKEVCSYGRKELEEEYFKNLINLPLEDATGAVSGIMVPIHYTKEGYIPIMTTVSEEYAEDLITNEAVSPGLMKDLSELYKAGKFRGLLNALNANHDPAKRLGLVGYSYAVYEVETTEGKKLQKTSKDLALEALKQANGEAKANMLEDKVREFEDDGVAKIVDELGYKKVTLKTEALATYTKDTKRINTKWNDIQIAKAKNKLNLIKRLATDSSTDSLTLAGLPGRKVQQIGALNLKKITGLEETAKGEELIEKLKDCHLTVSWGRGDLQKGLDTTMKAWAKLAEKDQNAFLVLGGELPKEGEAERIRIDKVITDLSKKFEGRFVFLNGFAPGLAFSMTADIASFPSRFAPCELTDLEAMKLGVIPVVTNCQGLAQKNFDPELDNIYDERQTSFKTLHQYSMSHDKLVEYDETMQKAIDWLDSKKEIFQEFLEGDKEKGYSYKGDKTAIDIINTHRKTILKEFNESLIKKDDNVDNDVRELLRASYEFKTSGFKAGYEEMEKAKITTAKNIAQGKIADSYRDDLIEKTRKSDDYQKLLRDSCDAIIENELAMAMLRSRVVDENKKKQLFKNAVSLDTSLTGNADLHKTWNLDEDNTTNMSTQDLYKKAHLERQSKKSDKLLKIHAPKLPKTKENKKLNYLDKIKDWWKNLSTAGKWGVGVGAGLATVAVVGGGIYAGIKADIEKQQDLDIDNDFYIDNDIDIDEDVEIEE